MRNPPKVLGYPTVIAKELKIRNAPTPDGIPNVAVGTAILQIPDIIRMAL